MPKLIDVAEMIQDEVRKALTERGYVQIIRCKDCKHFDDEDLAAGKKRCFCYIHGEFLSTGYFCASAERREK